MKNTIILILISAFLTKSLGQDGLNIPYPKASFKVKLKEKMILLPDSVRSSSFHKGLCVISLNINKLGRIKGFNIIKLRIENLKDDEIDFVQVSRDQKKLVEYPKEVQLYYPLLQKYLKTVKIEKIKGMLPKKNNYFTILLRFK
jgi:hypothetical protein